MAPDTPPSDAYRAGVHPSAHIDRPDRSLCDVVVWLDDPRALDSEQAGAKAANLALALSGGLRVLPGFVVTTAGTATGFADESSERDVVAAWSQLVDDGAAVVVRSSSTIEDAGESSMAGRFTSVLDVRGPHELLHAVRAVIASSRGVHDTHGSPRPIAVLVQRQLDTDLAGVLFGVDPVTGRDDHLVVEFVRSRPDALVSGRALAEHLVLNRRGHVVQRAAPPHAPHTPLGRRRRLEFIALADRAATTFGGPQDIEWAIDAQGALWLLQSRPVTAVGAGRHRKSAETPVLGPGPLAETFPHPLTPLEVDLWLAPMRTAMRRALLATGAARRSTIDRSPVVTAVRGRPAVDLALIGAISSTGAWGRLAPRVLARRLATAWRVGRLRVALPSMVATVATAVDDDLSRIGSLAELDDRTLVELLHRTRSEAATVHTFEMLCGMIQHAPAGAADVPLPVVAMRAIARLRADGFDDAAIIARSPEALALTVPAIGSRSPLPPVEIPDAPGRDAPDTRTMTDRDELRLRVRWLQELGARAATEIGHRAAATGAIDHPGDIRWATLTELDSLGTLRLTTDEVQRRASLLATDPLPVRFILEAGRVEPLSHIAHPRLHRRHRSEIHGMPASSGRALGTVVHDPPPAGEPTHTGLVLVTEHLDPTLATALPSMVGLVAETGSALSHLAILAREAHLPTVVAVPDARRRLPCGARVVVDGASGDVWVLGDDTHRHEEVQ